jgi:hypothetical protein
VRPIFDIILCTTALLCDPVSNVPDLNISCGRTQKDQKCWCCWKNQLKSLWWKMSVCVIVWVCVFLTFTMFFSNFLFSVVYDAWKFCRLWCRTCWMRMAKPGYIFFEPNWFLIEILMQIGDEKFSNQLEFFTLCKERAKTTVFFLFAREFSPLKRKFPSWILEQFNLVGLFSWRESLCLPSQLRCTQSLFLPLLLLCLCCNQFVLTRIFVRIYFSSY